MKRTLYALLIIGLLQCIAYCWALRSGGVSGVGCYDQGCYAQSARRITEGHAFSYSPGLAATTGQTSGAYPFVLSVPMALGAEGDRIRTVSLGFACVFYFVFLVCWGAVIGKFFADGVGKTAAVATLGLSGVCAYVAFTQCDQGLWMAVSAAIAAALAYRKERCAVMLLTLAPWVRPEGMAVVVAYAIVTAVGGRRWKLSLLPLASMAGVFALNYALTGEMQFSSVAEKGYFRNYPFVIAAWETMKDGLSIIGTYLCSVPVPAGRLFSMPSPVTALCFWIGLFVLLRRFREWSREALIMALAVAGSVGSVSVGGFAGLDFDRYLGWMMPVTFLIAACGIERLTSWIRSGFWRKLPIVALVMTTLFSTVSMILMMRKVSAVRVSYFEELREEAKLVPQDALIGSEYFVWAYDLPPTVRYREIAGIFTPAFHGRVGNSLTSSHEALKHDPSLRFDYWVTNPLVHSRDTPRHWSEARVIYGEPLLPGRGRRYLRRADWTAYDRAAESPLAPDEPTARLDVGYRVDERAARLRCLSLGKSEYERLTAVAVRRSDGLPMVDGYAPVESGQRFVLPTVSGAPARLVIRTLGALWLQGEDDLYEFSYGNSATLSVTVDDRELGSFTVPLQAEVFMDFVIEIPGEYIVSQETEFVVTGRFAAFGYWLYQ